MVVSDNMDSVTFDLDLWPELVVQTYDLSGSEMADYSVFPVANRTAVRTFLLLDTTKLSRIF